MQSLSKEIDYVKNKSYYSYLDQESSTIQCDDNVDSTSTDPCSTSTIPESDQDLSVVSSQSIIFQKKKDSGYGSQGHLKLELVNQVQHCMTEVQTLTKDL